MNKLERINKLHPDIITNFFEVGESSAIPKELQLYLEQISWATEIYQYERNLLHAAKELQKRVLATQKVKLSVNSCRGRVYDALNYFSIDCNVSQDVWDLDTANKLEELAKLATVKGDFKTAANIRLQANELKVRASSAQQTGTKTINYLLSPNLKADDLGFVDVSRKKIAQKANEGFYIKLINDLPVDKDEKKKLFADADITDVEEIND